MAGGVAKLAELLGVKRQGAYEWLKRGYLPPARAIQVEAAYGIPRAELIDPRLRAAIDSSDNPSVQGAKVQYAPRARKGAAEVNDLV